MLLMVGGRYRRRINTESKANCRRCFFLGKNGCPLLLLKLCHTQVDNGGPGKLYDYDLIKFVILLPIIILSKSSAVES